MLIHPTSGRLIALGFTGMAKALDEQRHAPTTFDSLGFEERLGLLVDREAAERDTKRLTARVKFEPPRVYRRVCGSMIRLLFRQHSSLRRRPPLLRSASFGVR